MSKGFDPSLNLLSLEELLDLYDESLEIFADYKFQFDPTITVAEATEAQRSMRDVARCLQHQQVPHYIDDNGVLFIDY